MPSFKLLYEQDGRALEFGNASVTIGREAACDLQLDHPTISRQHALIVAGPAGYDLVVLSTSGLTAVNGTQVSGSVPLADGCKLHFGQMAFVFHSDHAMSRTAAMPPVGSAPPHASTEPRYDLGAQQQPLGQQVSGQSQQHQGQAQFQGQPQQQNHPQFQGQPQQQNHPQFQGQPQHGTGQPQFQAQPGFGGPSGQQGFGAQVAQQGFVVGQQSNGSAPTVASPAVPMAPNGAPNPPSTGIKSWDDIASSPEAMDESDRIQEQTNFERMAAAQAKAKAQSGQNPLLIVGLVAIVGLVGFILFYDDAPVEGGVTVTDNPNPDFLTIKDSDIKCVTQSECTAIAERKYAVAMETYRKQGADIPNLFNSYLNFGLARKHAEKAHKLSKSKVPFKLPTTFSELNETEAKAEATLKQRFQDFKVRFHQAKQRREFKKMEQVIAEMRVNFPDSRAVPRRWADNKEIYMKENNMIRRK